MVENDDKKDKKPMRMLVQRVSADDVAKRIALLFGEKLTSIEERLRNLELLACSEMNNSEEFQAEVEKTKMLVESTLQVFVDSLNRREK